MASTSGKIVAPVVLNPDIVSKNASAKSGIVSDNTKGKVPKTVKLIQPQTVIKYPCCRVIFLIAILLAKYSDKPINKQIIDELKKCDHEAEVQYISENAGTSIASPSTLIK